MVINIVSLFVYVFGAYAYGHLTAIELRSRARVAGAGAVASSPVRQATARTSLAMFAVCTTWFVLHSIIELRALLGDSRQNDLVDLATLELVFMFPALIFHMYLVESRSVERPLDRAGVWKPIAVGLYVVGASCAAIFTAMIFGLVPAPQPLGAYIGLSVGTLFTVMSIFSLLLTRGGQRPSTRDQERLRQALRLLFIALILVFLPLNLLREQQLLIELLDAGLRATPLAFLLVSVYFEHRVQFYDLVIKRGILMLLSVVLTGAVLTLTLPWTDGIPPGAARPWLFAMLLLPVALLMPWLHGRVGRLLDRLWFGREFTPMDAITHVLGGMQRATDEPSLRAAAEATLAEMFRRRMVIALDDQPLPEGSSEVVDIRTPVSGTQIRMATVPESTGRALLSEDLVLLKSLGSVFGFMLENVRLQRRRQEQEQVAQELRLQTSRSELKALRAQINPHFLFNALNAIASLIHTDPARADAAVEQLAEVFRYTLRRSEHEWAPLDQELAFARAYLDVEQARFGRRLTFSIDADPALARAHVPSMLLQTLVENAVKHGISRLRTPGRIDVQARRDGTRVRLEVRDTGPGPDAAHDPRPAAVGESFGLRSVRDRLEKHFGGAASLALQRDGEVTVAAIEMPLVEEVALAAGAAR